MLFNRNVAFSVATINATIQLLDLYIYLYTHIYKYIVDYYVPAMSSTVACCKLLVGRLDKLIQLIGSGFNLFRFKLEISQWIAKPIILTQFFDGQVNSVFIFLAVQTREQIKKE